MASGAFPFLADVPPAKFLRARSPVAEMGIKLRCSRRLSDRLAGAPLTAFAGALLTMYLRTPALHRPGSAWPTPAGIAVSKDVWMWTAGAPRPSPSVLTLSRRRGAVRPLRARVYLTVWPQTHR